MKKVLRKSDMNRVVKKLADVFALKYATAIGDVQALSSQSSKKTHALRHAQLKKYQSAKPAMDRLLTIAQTPTLLTQALLAEAWDAILDLAMDMGWSIERGLCRHAYEVIDELRMKFEVNSTNPAVYGDWKAPTAFNE